MKLPALRLATPDEITQIAETSDLTRASSVVTLDTSKGPIFGVVKHSTELDPVIFPEGCGDRDKYLFLYGVISSLRVTNMVQDIYFQIPAEESRWKTLIENCGAENTSLKPEFRYRLGLQYVPSKDENKDNQ